MSEGTPTVIGFKQPADFYFRAAVRAMQARDYPGAVMNARTASSMAPETAEYLLLLAQALYYVHAYDTSTYLYFRLLENDCGMDAECFYGLGQNFMAIYDYAQALECFEEFLNLESGTSRAVEVHELLDVVTQELGERTYADKEEETRSAQAKNFLENGQFEQVTALLEGSSQPYDLNNLALAYFHSGRREESLEVTNRVLEMDPGNIHAICNMAIFLNEMGQQEESRKYVQTLDHLQPEMDEYVFKIAATFCQLREHEFAYQHLHRYNQTTQSSSQSLFFEAIAAFNTHRFKEAIHVLSIVRKIDDPPLIADYFIQLSNAVISDESAYQELPYQYALPDDEAKERFIYLNRCLRLDEQSFQELWRQDSTFKDTVKWALKSCEESTQIPLAVMIAGFADTAAEELLREFLLMRQQPDSVKNEILMLLAYIAAREPYMAFLGGEVVEVRKSALGEIPEKLSAHSSSLFGLIREIAEYVHRCDLLEEMLELAAKVMHSDQSNALYQHLPELAIAIIWFVADAHLRPFGLEETCSRFGAHMQRTKAAIDTLLELFP